MPADVGYDKKRSENHDIYWRESHEGSDMLSKSGSKV